MLLCFCSITYLLVNCIACLYLITCLYFKLSIQLKHAQWGSRCNVMQSHLGYFGHTCMRSHAKQSSAGKIQPIIGWLLCIENLTFMHLHGYIRYKASFFIHTITYRSNMNCPLSKFWYSICYNLITCTSRICGSSLT